MQKTWVRSLGWEDPLEKGMAAHSRTLAWSIPWTEEPGELYIVHRVAKSWTQLSNWPFHILCVKSGYIFTSTFYFVLQMYSWLSISNVETVWYFPQNQVFLYVTCVGGRPQEQSWAPALPVESHGLLLPPPSGLTEVSCNPNHHVTSISVTPSSLSWALDQE